MTTSSSPPKTNASRRSLLRDPVTLAPFLLLVAFSLTLILNVIPFYNWWYGIFFGVLGNLLLLISPVATLILLVISLYRRQGRRLILIAIWALAMFFTWRYILPLRVPITAEIIQRIYCQDDRPGNGEVILGGIKHVGHVFINDSHCIFPNCLEEFYYCER